MNFNKMFCRFDFGKSDISYEELKSIIDFQNSFFDEISVQKIGRNFNKLERCYEYSCKYNKPISLIIDVKQWLFDLKQELEYISVWNLSNIRFIYGKFSTHYSKYLLISELDKKIPFYLIGCQKRCGIKDIEDNCSNIPVQVLARSRLFNFDACCLNVRPKVKGARFKPPKTMSYFDTNTLLWEERINDHLYEKQRLKDFVNFNNVKIDEKILNKNPLVTKVINYLDNLNS